MPRDEREREAGRTAEIETLRVLREYRRLVLLGRVRPPLAEGRRLVGPDCAFHLYFRHAPPAGRARPATRGRGRKRRSRRRQAAPRP